MKFYEINEMKLKTLFSADYALNSFITFSYHISSTTLTRLSYFYNLAPDPPANLSINVRPNKHVHLTWDPPSVGGYSKFKLRLIPLSDREIAQPRNFIEEKPPVILRDLVAGKPL